MGVFVSSSNQRSMEFGKASKAGTGSPSPFQGECRGEDLCARCNRVWRFAIVCVALLTLTGCPPGGPNSNTGVPPVPPDPRAVNEILESINANAALLNQPLWSNSVSVTADFVDSRGKSHSYNLDGSLLYRKPRELRVDLRPSVGDPVMQIGSNNETFWMWVEPEMQMMRWGKHEHVGKPCSGRMSIRPDQLVAALGLSRLEPDQDGLIGPAIIAGKEYDRLQYLRKYDNKTYIAEREYWVDRSPPFMVRYVTFRDAQGKQTMIAGLGDYKRAGDEGPLVPHQMVFEWPQERGRLRLTIRKIGAPTGAVNPRAFVMPDERRLPRGITDVEQVDAECDGAAPRRRSNADVPPGIYDNDARYANPRADGPPGGEPGDRARDVRPDGANWSRPREPIPEGYGPPDMRGGQPRRGGGEAGDPRIETHDRNRPAEGNPPPDGESGGAYPPRASDAAREPPPPEQGSQPEPPPPPPESESGNGESAEPNSDNPPGSN